MVFTNSADMRRLAAGPSYQSYVDKKKKQGKPPLSKDEWERKVLNTGQSGKEYTEEKGKPEKGDKGDKGKAPSKSPKSVEMTPSGYKSLADTLQGWNKPGAWEHVISYALSGKPMQGPHVDSVISDIEDDLANWDAAAKRGGWDANDKKSLTKAKKLLEKARGKAPKAPEVEGKKPDKGKSEVPKGNKTYTKAYAKPVTRVMDKYSLTDTDADAVLQFKKGKPFTGEKITDAEKMRRFLAKAKPETKERMKGVSIADFIEMLGAIMDDEEGGGGKQASMPVFFNSADMRQAAAAQDGSQLGGLSANQMPGSRLAELRAKRAGEALQVSLVRFLMSTVDALAKVLGKRHKVEPLSGVVGVIGTLFSIDGDSDVRAYFDFNSKVLVLSSQEASHTRNPYSFTLSIDKAIKMAPGQLATEAVRRLY